MASRHIVLVVETTLPEGTIADYRRERARRPDRMRERPARRRFLVRDARSPRR
jgi:hypothetical protein